MMGMFQSRRMASGNPRLQTSRAFSPSSASTIWKSRPSRMRLATFRMTLESSTTRHVFIVVAFMLGKPGWVLPHCVRRISSGHHIGQKLKHPVDVQNDHQLTVEAVNAAGELGHARI